MQTKKPKVNQLLKEYAVRLRREGKQYKQIVELCSQIDKYNSVTLDWCKRNLKDVEIEDNSDFAKEENCLKQILNLAILPKGVTSVECKKIIKYNLNCRSEELLKLYKKYKLKVTQTNNKAFFRPSCLQPNRARESFKDILNTGNYLYDVICDSVEHLCNKYPEVYAQSIRRDLANLIFPELNLMGGGALTRMQTLEKAVEILEQRVPQVDSV